MYKGSCFRNSLCILPSTKELFSMNYVKKSLDCLMHEKNISQLADKIPAAESETILAHADE